MTLLPIMQRELGTEQRTGRLAKARLTAAAISAVIVLVLGASELWFSGFNIRKVLTVVPVLSLLPFALFIIGLSRADGLLATERREGTLSLLLLTHLNGHDIVLGKILQALLIELTLLLATVPAAVLPLVVVGYTLPELGMCVLGALNILFSALAIGMAASVLVSRPGLRTALWCPFLPLIALSTPLGSLLPVGSLRSCLSTLQWLNPCEPLAHVQAAAAGLRPWAFWWPLFTSHLTAWGIIWGAGKVLPWAVRRSPGPGRRPRSTSFRSVTIWRKFAKGRARSTRRLLLDRNPFLWLCLRDGWPTAQVWGLLASVAVFWGWLTWLSWIVRGLNVVVVFAVALAASWGIMLAILIPRQASRRLVDDRQSGALELLLCTPLDVNGIVHGQWLALRRQYLRPALLFACTCALLMVSGYATFGFGGMLDPEDRGTWLFLWSTAILAFPIETVALCWVAMNRALRSKTSGEACGTAFLQVIGIPAFLLWAIYGITVWRRWEIGFGWLMLMIALAFAIAPGAMALRARRDLREKLRSATALRYATEVSGTFARPVALVKNLWAQTSQPPTFRRAKRV